jgi:uncharacterized protein YdaU (DUF1376 family)
VNFFKLYIGDYQRDTAALSLAEHGAYLLMLQHYYATERPLPTGRELYRLMRAETRLEREAVDSVARRFWRVTDDGLVNERADVELRKAEHQRTVNREIGKRGGRPKKTESVSESVSESEPKHNPNQTPDYNSPPPSLRSGAPPREARGSRLPPDWTPSADGWAFACRAIGTTRAPQELAKFADYWAAKSGAGGRALDWEAVWRNWVRKAVEYAESRGTGSGGSGGNGARKSVVDRVREANREALEGDGDVLAAHGGNLRPQVDERPRRDADGVVVDGAFRVVG